MLGSCITLTAAPYRVCGASQSIYQVQTRPNLPASAKGCTSLTASEAALRCG